MIKIENLKVEAEDKEILKGINMTFESGKNYLILGKNGSGKSSLATVLAGNPKYNILSGSISINSKDLIAMSPDDRSREGLFLSFQNVPEIKGITLGEYLRVIYNTHKSPPSNSPLAGGEQNSSFPLKRERLGGGGAGLSPFLFKRFVKKYFDELDIEDSFLNRDLNVGFSGGEKRKIEILQMKLIGPSYIILDEIDSGLDLNAFKTIASILKNLSNENNSFIIITHYFKILEFLDISKVYVIENGKVIKEGSKELAKEISVKGFEK